MRVEIKFCSDGVFLIGSCFFSFRWCICWLNFGLERFEGVGWVGIYGCVGGVFSKCIIIVRYIFVFLIGC